MLGQGEGGCDNCIINNNYNNGNYNINSNKYIINNIGNNKHQTTTRSSITTTANKKPHKI